MSAHHRALALLLCVGSAGCGNAAPPLPSGGEPPAVELLPDGKGAARPYSRIAASFEGQAPLLLLFEGELGAYHERRVRSGDLPRTLEERRVALIHHEDPAGRGGVWVPERLLAPGLHSVATEGDGLLTTFDVRPSEQSIARRIWPPDGEVTEDRHVVYCADGVFAGSDAVLVFEPGQRRARLSGARESERGWCALLELDGALADGERIVPPQRSGDFIMDPRPVAFGATQTDVSRECAPLEVPFGPGCAVVLDDRIIVRPPVWPVLWWVSIEGPAGSLGAVEVTRDGRALVLRGLTPATVAEVALRAISISGQEDVGSLEIEAANPRPHVVIDEVLANPIGPEPEQEWVELLNDGDAPVDLGGWLFADMAGSVRLPPHRLQPGERALVVTDGFVLPNEPDVPVGPDVPLLRVAALGANGLSNSGETLRLLDPDERVISAFPAIPAPSPGVSVRRLEPWIPHDDPRGFAAHEEPGASPGVAAGR